MNILTDAKNMIHPEVYKQLVAKAAEKGFPVEFALVYFFNRLSMKSLGLQYGDGEMFWSHDEDLSFLKKSELVTEVTSPVNASPTKAPSAKTAASTTPTEKSADTPWYEGFPKRAINAILAAKIQSMEDLVNNYGVEDFAELAGAGESTAIKLAEVLLSEHGLTMKRGKQFKAPEVKRAPAAPTVSTETSAKLSAKTRALEEKITTAPKVTHLEEDEVIATDFYKKISDLNIGDPNNTSWVEEAIRIYSYAWECDLKLATGMVRDCLRDNKVTSKDHSTWAKGREVLLQNLPIQDDQIELINNYAKEHDIEDIEAYVLAELDIEGGIKGLTCKEASELMQRFDKGGDDKEWF